MFDRGEIMCFIMRTCLKKCSGCYLVSQNLLLATLFAYHLIMCLFFLPKLFLSLYHSIQFLWLWTWLFLLCISVDEFNQTCFFCFFSYGELTEYWVNYDACCQIRLYSVLFYSYECKLTFYLLSWRRKNTMPKKISKLLNVWVHLPIKMWYVYSCDLKS